ncbi:MAG: hypothetical protein U0W40_13620 [Acidimicrobiia bacterium]
MTSRAGQRPLVSGNASALVAALAAVLLLIGTGMVAIGNAYRYPEPSYWEIAAGWCAIGLAVAMLAGRVAYVMVRNRRAGVRTFRRGTVSAVLGVFVGLVVFTLVGIAAESLDTLGLLLAFAAGIGSGVLVHARLRSPR